METITLLAGGTTSTAGGANQVFNPIGKTVANGKAFGDVAVSDLTERNEVMIKSRAASYNSSTELWSKQKVTSTFLIPYYDANGNQFFSLVRTEMEVAPEHLSHDSTLIATLREQGAQLIMDAEMDATWETGAY